MSKKRSQHLFLKDILEAIRRITLYMEEGDKDSFLEDLKTQDAVIRNLEIIGEATKNLTPELREQHSHIPWKAVAGLRDKLIHQYFGIDYDIIWRMITVELKPLKQDIDQILTQMENPQ